MNLSSMYLSGRLFMGLPLTVMQISAIVIREPTTELFDYPPRYLLMETELTVITIPSVHVYVGPGRNCRGYRFSAAPDPTTGARGAPSMARPFQIIRPSPFFPLGLQQPENASSLARPIERCPCLGGLRQRQE